MKLEIEIPDDVIEKDNIKSDIADIIYNGIIYAARINDYINLENTNINIHIKHEEKRNIEDEEKRIWETIEKYYKDDIKHHKLDAINAYRLYTGCTLNEAYRKVTKHFNI